MGVGAMSRIWPRTNPPALPAAKFVVGAHTCSPVTTRMSHSGPRCAHCADTKTARPVASSPFLRHRSLGSNSSASSTYPTKGGFMESVLLDVAGRRRSPATMPGYHRGRPPRNKGEQYPADPPTVEEIVAVMSAVGDRADGHRLRALVVLLWRAGLRISEALSLQESDLDRTRGAVLVRHGLCRTRHNPCYAEAGVMPRRRTAARFSLLRRGSEGEALGINLCR